MHYDVCRSTLATSIQQTTAWATGGGGGHKQKLLNFFFFKKTVKSQLFHTKLVHLMDEVCYKSMQCDSPLTISALKRRGRK